ncbi:MAG: PHP domain-containing protein [Spirochaetales bacterium]|nr:PHP domain-containing protein [Spirochaetales bacterium]
MNIDVGSMLQALNSPDYSKRFAALLDTGKAIQDGAIFRDVTQEVNNHVHTTYSFSPYEPAMAAFKAWEAGLQIVGSIDHDSISAAEEMLLSGNRLGIATTVGFEVRCSFKDTKLKDRKINNPDSRGIVYMCIHGVPADKIAACREFLKPIGVARKKRDRAEVAALNKLISRFEISRLDFDRDILPLSRSGNGGSITERHILSALAAKIISEHGKGEPVVDFLENRLKMVCGEKVRSFLLDTGNPHYLYDLIGVLKGGFLPEFFIQPDPEEILPAREVVGFAHSIGAIPAYAYLGDVTNSATGDKKAEKFEDSYLEELFSVLNDIGYSAVTYMPPRNTKEQLLRVQGLAKRYGMMEISGVDINSSRQKFNCPELLQPEFVHLLDSAWALVAHEKLAFGSSELGLFHIDNPLAGKPIEKRIAVYAEIGRQLNPFLMQVPLDDIRKRYGL